jgi:hypothetical protein
MTLHSASAFLCLVEQLAVEARAAGWVPRSLWVPHSYAAFPCSMRVISARIEQLYRVRVEFRDVPDLTLYSTPYPIP